MMHWRDNELLDARKEIAMEKKLDGSLESLIGAIYFWEQYDSPRCCKTVDEATEQYNDQKSKTAKLRAVKEQILIRYLGLG